jgi:hypothetical protein
MILPESQKRAQTASSAPGARRAVYQPVIEGWPVIRPEREFLLNECIGDYALIESPIGWSVSKAPALTIPDESVEVVSDEPRSLAGQGTCP